MNGEETGREGIVFNIQRYSIHDGPGIRTTVFLKGCPLRCKWCSNPESINPYPEIFFREEKCDRCGKCLDVCLQNAIVIDENNIRLDRTKCNLCTKCNEVCHAGVIDLIGKKMTIEKVINEVMQDELFYKNSGGGITISGGEPLYQAKFTLNLIKVCKEKSLHTALDTTGYAKWEELVRILKYTDLILFDIKHLNREMHQKCTEVSNEIILRNLDKILKKGVRIWIRIPVIPNYNNSIPDIESIANFLAKKPIEKVSLLGYHIWGSHKYKYLGKDYPLRDVYPINDKKLQSLKNVIESYGLRVTLNY